MLVCDRLIHHPLFARSQRIAAYVGSKGEIDPMPLLHIAHAMGKQCFLPILHPFRKGRLWFAPWKPDSPMLLNSFNIPEPAFTPSQCCKPQFLELVLTPLLGFDAHCHRLGMGGGYYDRTFSFRRFRRRWHGPQLIGLAHSFQQTSKLPVNNWDVQLDGVVTPSRFLAAGKNP